MAKQDERAALQDPVVRRMRRIIDAKRRENERTIGALDRLEESWEPMNKELDESIGSEFELVAADIEALDRAKDEIKTPKSPKNPKGFVLGGKIQDPDRTVGVSNVGVRVLHLREDGSEEVLTTTKTDNLGNFTQTIPTERLPAQLQKLSRIRVEAFRTVDPDGFDEAEPILAEEMKVRLKAGEAKEVKVAAGSRAEIEPNIAAGKSARDSVAFAADTVAKRLKGMRASHTALTRLAATTHDDLRRVREELSVEQPDVARLFAAPPTGEPPGEPQKPTGSTRPPPARPERPTRPAQVAEEEKRLGRIKGVGPASIDKLRAVNIKSLNTFARASDKKLREALGNVDVDRMKKEAAGLSDLESVDSVGPARAKKLRTAGIRDLQDIADAKPEEIRKVLGNVDTAAIKRSSSARLRRIRG